MARIQVDDKIKIAFNFNNSDLQDNRQGFMSFRQKRKLRLLSILKFDWLWAIFGVVLIILMTVAIMFFTFQLYTMPASIFDSFALILTILSCIFVEVGLLVIFFEPSDTGHWTTFNRDIRLGQINNVEVQVDSRHPDGYRRLNGEAHIKINTRQLAALQDNYTYRMYYALNTFEILSVEIVRVDRGPRDKL